MKKTSILILTLLSLFMLSSCESDDGTTNTNTEIPEEEEPTTEEPEEEITDDYYLLAVTSEGEVYKIGNNTGEVNQTGQIPTSNNLIMLSTICKVDSKIYAFEVVGYPLQNFLIYDELTNSTTITQLTFPSSITSVMSGAVISNAKYNGSELIALVVEEYSNNPAKVVSIDLQSYEVTDLGISFPQKDVVSMELINNDLFVVTAQNGFIKINLDNGSVTELQNNGNRINGTRITKISDSKIAIMSRIPVIINGVKPFEYDLSTNTFSDKSLGNNYGLGNITGKSFFHNGEVLDFVFIENNEEEPNEDGSIVYHPNYILKANFQTNEIKTVKVLNEQRANIVIVGVLE